MTIEEIEALNETVDQHFGAEEVRGVPYRFAPSKLDDEHLLIVDPEWDYAEIIEVRVELAQAQPVFLLTAIWRASERARRLGEECGKRRVQRDLLTVLGIAGTIARADAEQRQADERGPL